MISLSDAQAKLESLVSALPSEHVDLENAGGRVLAASIQAPCDWPLFDTSQMDGYAVKAEAGPSPWRLTVHGESRAGSVPFDLTPGAAARIFTGAPLPRGADAVVMQEESTRVGPDEVELAHRPETGSFVRARGAEHQKGDRLLEAGTILGPRELALAASADHARLLVARKPIVAILSTGDELRDPGSAARPGTIPDGNRFAIQELCRRTGAEPRVPKRVEDSLALTTRALAQAAESADLVVTIGGVSVGEHDHVRPALDSLGAKTIFSRVAIKPGKPLTVATLGRALVVALPGNPVSAILAFGLFGAPIVRMLQGVRDAWPRRYPAKLTSEHRRPTGRLELVRCRISHAGAELLWTPMTDQASSAITTLASADAVALLPPGDTPAPAGEAHDIIFSHELGC